MSSVTVNKQSQYYYLQTITRSKARTANLKASSKTRSTNLRKS